MSVNYRHVPHPRIEEHRKEAPPRGSDEHVGANGRVALWVTATVGTMWCAYFFAVLAFIALPSALGGGILAIIQWISQTFIQLVMLSVIMVGQNILGAAADKRSEATYKDAEAIFAEAQQIQDHLEAQDDAMNEMLEKILRMEAALAKS
jgi:hypothetical protein